jgi:type III secretion protein R
MWFVVISFGFALIPTFLGVATSYLKVSIVLSMLRSGLGLQQIPGNLVIMVISLALTAFIMQPVLKDTWKEYQQLPDRKSESMDIAYVVKGGQAVSAPLMRFMRKHAGETELHALREMVIQNRQQVDVVAPIDSKTREETEDAPSIVILAFVLSELKEAFSMGFVLLLPFLAIDLIVANVLVGMGMFMVSPVMISLPLKVLLFVAGDGWLLLFKGLYLSYGV